jgi:predicted nucleotidyltransferase
MLIAAARSGTVSGNDMRSAEAHGAVAVEWPRLWPSWLTPEIGLDAWRDRIERVATEESAHFASLPYVEGVAIIGSVGRGDPWPLSDVDLLVVAGPWQGQDPGMLVHAVEEERNRRLDAARVPHEVEARLWLWHPEQMAATVGDDDEAFLSRHADWPYTGVPAKVYGARVVADRRGQVGRFVKRCNRVVFDETFLRVWLHRVITDARADLGAAWDLADREQWAAASLQLVQAADAMMFGFYGVWRRLPQSLGRAVTRFLAAADSMGDSRVGELLLRAARLDDETLGQRLAAVPPAGRRERDVCLAIRRGAGEDVDESAVSRDMLHLATTQRADGGDASGGYPAWIGVTDDATAVGAQRDAAEELLRRLESAGAELAGAVR